MESDGAMQWYYARQGAQSGPVSTEEMRRLISSRAVLPTDLVWRDGMAQWTPLAQVSELASGPSIPGPAPMPTPLAVVPGASYGGSAPGAGASVGPCPDNWLWQAIVATLCCCLPLGVASIVFAAQVKSKWQAGDQAGAIESARKAKIFFWWAFGLGIIGNLIYIVVSVLPVIAEHF